jgi:hypothetical protein
MRPKTKATVLSLIVCMIVNGVLVGGLFIAGSRTLQTALAGFETQTGQVDGGVAAEAPPPAVSGSGAEETLRRALDLLPPVVLGGGAFLTMILWLAVQGIARRTAAAEAPPPQRSTEKPGKAPDSPPEQRPLETVEASPGPAVQILSILQRQGRMIDFLQENLDAYDDAQIGAAVRSIHQGCRSALAEHIELVPIYEDPEGEAVTVPEGFNASQVRLTGSVSGEPPFRGVLQHRGWRIRRIELPRMTEPIEKDWIIAPAEVEIAGRSV